jgi:hypothetical protein
MMAPISAAQRGASLTLAHGAAPAKAYRQDLQGPRSMRDIGGASPLVVAAGGMLNAVGPEMKRDRDGRFGVRARANRCQASTGERS